MLADRAVIRLSGDGVRDFLQGLVTNDVAGALPVWAGLLTPQGKALFDFIVWSDPAGGDDLLIDCEAAQADALVRRLSIYRLRRPIVIARDDAMSVHWALDPTACIPAQGMCSPDPRHDALGHRWLAAHDGSDASATFRAHRLSLGIVEGAGELGQDQTLWLEANAREQHGVSFTKGCYIGQENTARMHHRDKVRRRLAVVALAQAGDGPRVTYPDLGLAVVVSREG